jgi:hypothetical protein
MMPTYIQFHEKMILATYFIVNNVDSCEHDMVINDDSSYCKKCGANYFEAIEFKYERKEYLISRDILNGLYTGRNEKFFK